MIQATDIRIGNYLTYHGDTDMPCKIDAQDIYNIELNYMFNAEIHSPIPLTEEILLKCGFEKRDKTEDGVIFGLLNFTLIFGKTMDSDFAFFLNGYHNDCNLQYLHQLQNLYWCLCGKELEVNL